MWLYADAAASIDSKVKPYTSVSVSVGVGVGAEERSEISATRERSGEKGGGVEDGKYIPCAKLTSNTSNRLHAIVLPNKFSSLPFLSVPK